ncbi:hypothetical protein GBAR_LOCUS19584 [Geodia barretti]|uniref:Uncharacterized protein n=1 Tax=Geodia barretti TaxID=519541 RepID=A0AA35SSH6_GEOBA|nr:hypothetical protein GBAR_LOCUS19584 [Geodia barretti]
MALFRPIRRMLSPREGRGHEETAPDTPVASSRARLSTGDSESVVENAIYSEPTPLDRVEPQRHSHHRISGGEDPPLPPRPLSGGGAGGAQQNSEEHETYYQAPVDTLGRGVGLDPQAAMQQQRMTSIRERERAAAERERRRMNMHERTLNQIQGAGGYPVHLQGRVGGLGHRRTRSGGHIIDNEEYSTPWDVQGEQRRRASGHNPPKPARNRRPIPATPNDGSDNSVSPVPPRSPVQVSGDAEYDDPWDVRNRNISQVIPSQRHHTHSSLHERRSPPSAGDHRPPMRQSVGSRTTEHSRPHLEEVRPSRSLSDWNHPRGVPTEPPEQFRPRTITDVHPPHSLSHSNPSSPRTSSMCAPTHPIQRRPLPEEPPGGGTGAATTPTSCLHLPRSPTLPAPNPPSSLTASWLSRNNCGTMGPSPEQRQRQFWPANETLVSWSGTARVVAQTTLSLSEIAPVDSFT